MDPMVPMGVELSLLTFSQGGESMLGKCLGSDSKGRGVTRWSKMMVVVPHNKKTGGYICKPSVKCAVDVWYTKYGHFGAYLCLLFLQLFNLSMHPICVLWWANGQPTARNEATFPYPKKTWAVWVVFDLVENGYLQKSAASFFGVICKSKKGLLQKMAKVGSKGLLASL